MLKENFQSKPHFTLLGFQPLSREGPQRHFDVNRRAVEWVKFGRDSLVVVSSPTHLPFSPRTSLVAYFSFISLIAPHSCSIKHPPANLWILMTHGNELPCGNAIRRLAGRSTEPPRHPRHPSRHLWYDELSTEICPQNLCWNFVRGLLGAAGASQWQVRYFNLSGVYRRFTLFWKGWRGGKQLIHKCFCCLNVKIEPDWTGFQ